MQVDLPLDDIISKQRKGRFGQRSFRGSRMPGRGSQRNVSTNMRARPPRRSFGNSRTLNNNSANISRSPKWKRDLGSAQPQNDARKILVTNLSFMVTDDDVRELFSECGQLKRAAINYDKSGRSHGSAEISFLRREDAAAAIRRYNNVQLDGRPMKIQFIASKTGAARISRGERGGEQTAAPRKSNYNRISNEIY